MEHSDNSLWAVIEARDAAIVRLRALRDCDSAALAAKEAEIRTLDAALQQARTRSDGKQVAGKPGEPQLLVPADGTRHRFVEASDLGQELEYRLAATLLGAFEKPSVVDVGVERGSFVDLALRAGAGIVIGFEPLPRHFESLARRYSGEHRVHIHQLAISSSGGMAQLHVALDPDGNELDYHHSLSDLGDSPAVIRSRRAVPVRTATLGDLARDRLVPLDIDFLKVDTDGHDLEVLHGLGALRPKVIMAEYWDTLPESSGRNPFTLADLSAWARSCGYRRMFVVRRHGPIELVQFDAPWTIAGDWGNVFFLRDDFDLDRIAHELRDQVRQRYETLCGLVGGLARENEAKEAEIRKLDTALQATRMQLASSFAAPTNAQAIRAQLMEKDAIIHALVESMARAESQREQLLVAAHDRELDRRAATAFLTPEVHALLVRGLEEKEAVIQQLKKALGAYRSAFAVKGFFTRPIPLSNFSGLIPRPRLGTLYQHAPRDVVIPGSYSRAPVLAATPGISLVTPSFRQVAFIERTILSVLEQNYPNLEYYVQDGGSDDGTREILERHAGRLAGWDSRPDEGQSQAINLGFAHTSGEIMAWLNSDDILLPGALHCVVDFFNSHPEVDVIYGHRLLIDENDRQIGRWILPAHSDKILSWADYVPQETLFWRRGIWNKAGGRIDESFRFAMDWDLLLRFRDAGARFARIPRFLGGFRVHPQQKTSATIGEIGFQEMDRLRKRALGRVPTHLEVRRAVMPYLLRHVACEIGWRVRGKLGGHR